MSDWRLSGLLCSCICSTRCRDSSVVAHLPAAETRSVQFTSGRVHAAYALPQARKTYIASRFSSFKERTRSSPHHYRKPGTSDCTTASQNNSFNKEERED